MAPERYLPTAYSRSPTASRWTAREMCTSPTPNGNNVIQLAPDGTNLGVFCSAPLGTPHGMFFDSSGNLYVANSGVRRIEKFSSTGAYLGVFASTRSGPHFFALSPPTATPTPTPTERRLQLQPRHQRRRQRQRRRRLRRQRPRQFHQRSIGSRPTRGYLSERARPSPSARAAARRCFINGKRTTSIFPAQIRPPMSLRPRPRRITEVFSGS